MWERLGRPEPFTLVEVGPGDGTLAAGLAAELGDLPLDLVLCERAAGMLEQARARVPGARVAELAQLGGVHGAIVANEVHDACPAHRLRWPDELLVGVGPDRRFRFVPGPPAGRLGDALLARRRDAARGRRVRRRPAQAELQRTLARALARGALMVLDYGEAGAGRYERPCRACALRRRLRRRRSAVGAGDAGHHGGRRLRRRARAGEAEGLRTTLDVPQVEWLLARGAGAAVAELPRHDPERLWLEALSDPQGSGAAFRVLVQERE